MAEPDTPTWKQCIEENSTPDELVSIPMSDWGSVVYVWGHHDDTIKIRSDIHDEFTVDSEEPTKVNVGEAEILVDYNDGTWSVKILDQGNGDVTHYDVGNIYTYNDYSEMALVETIDEIDEVTLGD